MARFLSSEWFEELSQAGSGLPVAGEPPRGTVTIQQVVTGGPEGDVAYVIRVRDGRLEATPGWAGDANVTITEDLATAAALSRGELSARQALLAGRVQLRGDTDSLLASLAAMQAAQAGVDQVRSRTSY